MTETLLGSSGGKLPSASDMQSLDITPEAYKKLRSGLGGLLQNVLTGGQKGSGSLSSALAMVPQSTTKYAAPITAGEQSAIDKLLAGLNPSAGDSAAAGLLTSTLNGDYLSPESNPYLQKSIEDAIAPLRQEYQNTIMPNLRIGATQNGQQINPYGSSVFDKASALAANEYMRNVSATATKIAGDNYSAERTRQQEAVTQQQAGTQQNVQNLVSTLNAVALPRLIEQYGIDAGTQEFNTRMANLLQMMGLAGQVSGVSNAGVQPSQPTQGVLGDLIKGGAAMGAAAMSDRRLKADIRPVLSLPGKPTIYEFRYRGDPVFRWGFMADEVPEEARVVMPNGFLGIDTRKMGEVFGCSGSLA